MINMTSMYLYSFLGITIIFLAADISSSTRIGSSYGHDCLDECRTYGGAYSYCHIRGNSWDYCSNVKDVTSYGMICRADHSCGKYGRAYQWCYTDNYGNWDYCSDYYFQLFPYLTRYGYYCNDECRPHGRHGYNTCAYGEFRSGSREYCSREPDTTYQGEPCSTSHRCDRHGQNYYWCNKQNGGWDYCSPVNNCGYWPFVPDFLFRNKRDVHDNVCSLSTGSHNLFTEISIYRPSHRQLQSVSGRQVARVHHTIAQWNIEAVSGGARTLFQTSEYRIDLQGEFRDANNNRMANVQVQSNGRNSRTVAGVIVPMDGHFPVRFFRRAMVESLRFSILVTMNNVERNNYRSRPRRDLRMLWRLLMQKKRLPSL